LVFTITELLSLGILSEWPFSVRLYISMLLSCVLFFMLSIIFNTRNLHANRCSNFTVHSVLLGVENTHNTGRQSNFLVFNALYNFLICDKSISYAMLLVPSGHLNTFLIGNPRASNFSIEFISSNNLTMGLLPILISRSGDIKNM